MSSGENLVSNYRNQALDKKQHPTLPNFQIKVPTKARNLGRQALLFYIRERSMLEAAERELGEQASRPYFPSFRLGIATRGLAFSTLPSPFLRPALHSSLLPPAGTLIFWARKTRLPRRQFPDPGRENPVQLTSLWNTLSRTDCPPDPETVLLS